MLFSVQKQEKISTMFIVFTELEFIMFSINSELTITEFYYEFVCEFYYEISIKCYNQNSGHSKNHNEIFMIPYWNIMRFRSKNSFSLPFGIRRTGRHQKVASNQWPTHLHSLPPQTDQCSLKSVTSYYYNLWERVRVFREPTHHTFSSL